MGTIFEESKLPMTKWLQAIYLMCSSKKGVSSLQLARVLEVAYKTAWLLSHRISKATGLPLGLTIRPARWRRWKAWLASG